MISIRLFVFLPCLDTFLLDALNGDPGVPIVGSTAQEQAVLRHFRRRSIIQMIYSACAQLSSIVYEQHSSKVASGFTLLVDHRLSFLAMHPAASRCNMEAESLRSLTQLNPFSFKHMCASCIAAKSIFTLSHSPSDNHYRIRSGTLSSLLQLLSHSWSTTNQSLVHVRVRLEVGPSKGLTSIHNLRRDLLGDFSLVPVTQEAPAGFRPTFFVQARWWTVIFLSLFGKHQCLVS